MPFDCVVIVDIFHHFSVPELVYLLVIDLADNPWGKQRNGSQKSGNKGRKIVL